MVKYEQKFGKDRFRLGRVANVRRGEDGLVRTAWVGLRALRRAIREPADVCRAGLTMVELPVQRLVLLLPADEQPQEVLQGLQEFPPMPGLTPPPVPALVDNQRVAPQVAQPGVTVQLGEEVEEIQDLPKPQRAGARLRGRRS